MKISWISPEDLLTHELRQRSEEGLDVREFGRRWETIRESGETADAIRDAARKLHSELQLLSPPDELLKNEPSELPAIRAARPENPLRLPAANRAESALVDRISGGWLGRAAGCLLGKPVEKTPRAGIREMLVASGNWPLSDYITAKSVPDHLLKKYPWNRHSGRESLRENIVCMTEDDDMNYPMINLSVLETAGANFRTEDIAEAWLSLMPVLRSFTAERIAYINCLQLIDPPETARVNNPFREWIGAQIRADVWGWISPGNPGNAAALAWRDARLSHVQNGIYGEMFFAAVIAAAFACNDPAELLQHGLHQIPANSRLAEAIRFVLQLPSREPDFEAAVDRIYERFGGYHWVHTINNAALVAAALLFSNGDFETAICNVVMGGWDTDSNGATVGSIMGTMLGEQRLPAKWIDPLNDRIRSSLRGFDNSSIRELARRTYRLVL
ncbi:MAG: ADP-ribosylglycohydrolase family protein [Calditrichia bacterium]